MVALEAAVLDGGGDAFDGAQVHQGGRGVERLAHERLPLAAAPERVGKDLLADVHIEGDPADARLLVELVDAQGMAPGEVTLHQHRVQRLVDGVVAAAAAGADPLAGVHFAASLKQFEQPMDVGFRPGLRGRDRGVTGRNRLAGTADRFPKGLGHAGRKEFGAGAQELFGLVGPAQPRQEVDLPAHGAQVARIQDQGLFHLFQRLLRPAPRRRQRGRLKQIGRRRVPPVSLFCEKPLGHVRQAQLKGGFDDEIELLGRGQAFGAQPLQFFHEAVALAMSLQITQVVEGDRLDRRIGCHGNLLGL